MYGISSYLGFDEIVCSMSNGRKMLQEQIEQLEANEMESAPRTVDPTQDSIFPPQLKKWHPEDTLDIECGRTTWIVPCNLEKLRTVWTEHPTAQFVAGATALGVITKPDETPLSFICCHRVEELHVISTDDRRMEFGAVVTFSQMEDYLRELKIEAKQMVSAFLDCVRLLASDQIRNVANI